MCKYCDKGMSFVNTNMATVKIKNNTKGNNGIIKCFDVKGKEMIIPFNIKYCPMCGENLNYK